MMEEVVSTIATTQCSGSAEAGCKGDKETLSARLLNLDVGLQSWVIAKESQRGEK